MNTSSVLYIETGVYLGNEENTLQFLGWVEAFGKSEQGWLTATIAELRTELETPPLAKPYVPLGKWDTYEHQKQRAEWESNRTKQAGELVHAFASAGLTHMVIVSNYACDDEVQFVGDGAKACGCFRASNHAFNKNKPVQAKDIPHGEHLRVVDDVVVTSNLSFRLGIWRPLDTVYGYGEATQEDGQAYQAVFNQ